MTLTYIITHFRISQSESLFLKPPPRGNIGQLPFDLKKFCSCDKPSAQSPVCGKGALEDPSFSVGRPNEPVRANLPWWIRWNNNQKRKKRQTDSGGDDELTDDIDDEYEFIDNGEDAGSETEPSWPTWNNITETQANDHCDSYLRASPPYQACGDIIEYDEFASIVSKCIDDIQVQSNFLFLCIICLSD